MRSRREFVFRDLPGLATSFLYLDWLNSERVETLATGKLLDANHNLIGEELPIVGHSGFNYQVQTPQGLRWKPIKDIQVLDGYPFANIVTHSRLGIRLDEASYMSSVSKLGASIARISYWPIDELGAGGNFDQAILAAHHQGLKPLVVFNPFYPRDDDFIRQKISTILSLSSNSILELGNEPDDFRIEFWQNRDFSTFAHFVAVAINEARNHGYDRPLVLSALVNIGRTPEMLNALRAENVDISSLQFAVHGYQEVSQITSRVSSLKYQLSRSGISRPKIWLTEFGVNYHYRQKWVMVEMTRTAIDLGLQGAVIHQLQDYPQPEGSFGLASPDLSLCYPVFYGVASLVRQRTG